MAALPAGFMSAERTAPHVPVMAAEALDGLAIRPDGTYVDATFGAGGHARAIDALLTQGGRLLALDADPAAALYAGALARTTLVGANFADLSAVLDDLAIAAVDGVLFDLGVSSMQLDRPERGFSFREDGPLDMRLDPRGSLTAAGLLAEVEEAELADLIARYGEDRAARRIARSIVAARTAGRLPETTTGLARLIAGTVHVSGRRERIHPATRTFQALRIAVNDELGALARGLAAAVERTRPGGRIAVISFHSLEDRIVKRAFRDDPRVHAITRRPLEPGDVERAANPRSRSAKLRVAERIEG
jgi:16S rRNA (cytosine1402-N4)-methyltransferase